MSKIKCISTEIINKILQKYNNGEKLKRSESIFHQGQIGTLNYKFPFLFTKEEALEFSKCYNDPIYFIEKYCKVKLRDYQREWIKSYKDNKFNIFILSRQMGFSTVKSLLNLWEMLFHAKSILLITYMFEDSHHIEKMRDAYIELPYFLKQPLLEFDKRSIKFTNGSFIKINKKNSLVSNNYDIIDVSDAFLLSEKMQMIIIQYVIPVINALKNSKLCISGQPKLCPLYDLTTSSEFSISRTYWWQVSGRDTKWKEDMISSLGGSEYFDNEYNCLP